MAASEEHRCAQQPPRRHRLTVHDYLRMGESGILHSGARVELVDGEVIDMAPAGSRHAGVVRQIARSLDRAAGEAALVSVQSPIVLGLDSQPEPDIALLRPRADFYKAAHPTAPDILLLVEVADASLRFDRDVKIPLYARHGVGEVWLVDLEHDAVTIYRSPAADGYRAVAPAEAPAALAPMALPRAAINVAAALAR